MHGFAFEWIELSSQTSEGNNKLMDVINFDGEELRFAKFIITSGYLLQQDDSEY